MCIFIWKCAYSMQVCTPVSAGVYVCIYRSVCMYICTDIFFRFFFEHKNELIV